MTREEEIKEAAELYDAAQSRDVYPLTAFEAGAKWADSHQQIKEQQMLGGLFTTAVKSIDRCIEMNVRRMDVDNLTADEIERAMRAVVYTAVGLVADSTLTSLDLFREQLKLELNKKMYNIFTIDKPSALSHL